MKTLKRSRVIIILSIIIIIILLSFVIVYMTYSSGGISERQYVVERIYCPNYELADIVFKLKSEDEEFYINRGLQQGLSIDTLSKQALDSTVLIKKDRSNRIIKIELLNGVILYKR